MKFTDYLSENSRAKKAQKAFLGQLKNIKTIGIMSPENPMGNELSSAENKELREEFESILKEGNIKFFKIKGKYGSVEHSYFLYNVSLDFLKRACATDRFNQESFFFCKTKYDEETRKTGCVFEYYKKPAKGSHKLKETSEKYIDATSFEDFYSQIARTFKFSIAMKEFGNLAESTQEYSDCLESRRSSWDDDCYTFDEALDKITDSHYTGFGKWALRGKINQ